MATDHFPRVNILIVSNGIGEKNVLAQATMKTEVGESFEIKEIAWSKPHLTSYTHPIVRLITTAESTPHTEQKLLQAINILLQGSPALDHKKSIHMVWLVLNSLIDKSTANPLASLQKLFETLPVIVVAIDYADKEFVNIKKDITSLNLSHIKEVVAINVRLGGKAAGIENLLLTSIDTLRMCGVGNPQTNAATIASQQASVAALKQNAPPIPQTLPVADLIQLALTPSKPYLDLMKAIAQEYGCNPDDAVLRSIWAFAGPCVLGYAHIGPLPPMPIKMARIAPTLGVPGSTAPNTPNAPYAALFQQAVAHATIAKVVSGIVDVCSELFQLCGMLGDTTVENIEFMSKYIELAANRAAYQP